MANPQTNICSSCKSTEKGFIYINHTDEKWTEFDFSLCGVPFEAFSVKIDDTVWYPEWYLNFINEIKSTRVDSKSNVDEDTLINNIVDIAEVSSSINFRFMCLKCTKSETTLNYFNFLMEEGSSSLKSTAAGQLMENESEVEKQKLIRLVNKDVCKMYCICVNCNKKTAASIYAQHLSKYMGLSRRARYRTNY